jgi:hypothetical protein
MLLPAMTEAISVYGAVISILFIDKSMIIAGVMGVAYGIASTTGLPALGAVTQDVVHPSLKGMSWGMTVFCM